MAPKSCVIASVQCSSKHNDNSSYYNEHCSTFLWNNSNPFVIVDLYHIFICLTIYILCNLFCRCLCQRTCSVFVVSSVKQPLLSGNSGSLSRQTPSILSPTRPLPSKSSCLPLRTPDVTKVDLCPHPLTAVSCRISFWLKFSVFCKNYKKI